MSYKVDYTENVIEFILTHITSERAYNKIANYRSILTDFPEIGTPYQPHYPAAQPPFPYRWIGIPDTPFTFYYLIEESNEKVIVFHIEHQFANPRKRFDWSVIDL